MHPVWDGYSALVIESGRYHCIGATDIQADVDVTKTV